LLCEFQEYTAIVDPSTSKVVKKFPLQGKQSTFSPDGSLIAMSKDSSIVIVDFNGEIVHKINTRFPAFYIYWAPDSTRLTYLSYHDSSAQMALQFVDLQDPDLKVSVVDSTRPYFYQYAPYSSDPDLTLIRHSIIAKNPLVIVNVTTKEQISLLDSKSRCRMSTPIWINKNTFAFVQNNTTSAALNIGILDDNLKCQSIKEIGILDSTNASPHSAFDIISCRQSQKIACYLNELGKKVLVFDVLQEKLELQLQFHEVSCVEFSKDGKYLLVLESISDDFIWSVYDFSTQESYQVGNSFKMSRHYLQNYLPFFPQYSVSHTWISPDSKEFVYSTQTGEVFVCGLSKDSKAVKLELPQKSLMIKWSPV